MKRYCDNRLIEVVNSFVYVDLNFTSKLSCFKRSEYMTCKSKKKY